MLCRSARLGRQEVHETIDDSAHYNYYAIDAQVQAACGLEGNLEPQAQLDVHRQPHRMAILK